MNDAALVRRDERVGQWNGDLENAGERKSARRDEAIETLALDEFHRQEGNPLLVFHGEEGDDVRMVEPRDGSGLALESGAAVGGRRDGPGEDLDRHLATEACIPRPIDLAHPSRSERAGDLVGAETGARDERHSRRV